MSERVKVREVVRERWTVREGGRECWLKGGIYTSSRHTLINSSTPTLSTIMKQKRG